MIADAILLVPSYTSTSASATGVELSVTVPVIEASTAVPDKVALVGAIPPELEPELDPVPIPLEEPLPLLDELLELVELDPVPLEEPYPLLDELLE